MTSYIYKEPVVTLGYQVMMMSSKCLDLDCFELFSCVFFGGKYNSKRLKNIFHKFDSEPIVTVGYKSVMISSKSLDFNYFETALYTFFRWNNFSKRLR